MKQKRRFVQRMGTKNQIVFDVLENISNNCDITGRTFVDLFGGGGSVTANATYYFDKILYNEIDKSVFELFLGVQDDALLDSVRGRWITREEFKRIARAEKRSIEENLILTIWSFGNNRKNYLYGRDIEKIKKMMHNVIFSSNEEEYKNNIQNINDTILKECQTNVSFSSNDWAEFSAQQDRKNYKFGAKALREVGVSNIKGIDALQSMTNIESISRLQSLKRLQSLERIENCVGYDSVPMHKIQATNKDYREVELPTPDECIIYLDPPYRGVTGYEQKFDHSEFDSFVLSLKEK